MKVIFIAAEGVEGEDLDTLAQQLRAGGLQTAIASSNHKALRTWRAGEWSAPIIPDNTFTEINPSEWDAILIPGGQLHVEELRTNEKAVDLLRAFFRQGKIIAASRHGVGLLVEAGIIKGHRVAACRSLKTDIFNAGAEWSDVDVECDRSMVTARGNLPLMSKAIIKAIRNSRQKQAHQHDGRMHSYEIA